MEIQLQELIEQIKKEGIENAEAQASAMIEAAKVEAEKIIAQANDKANKILQQAKEDNERFVRSSEEAIRQAGRNLLISFRESVIKELEAVIGDNVDMVYSSDLILGLIVKVVELMAKTPETELTVLLNATDMATLEKGLLSVLKEKALKGVTLKANDNFIGGFRVLEKDGKAYYDFSAQEVIEMLSTYLSPRVTAILKEAK